MLFNAFNFKVGEYMQFGKSTNILLFICFVFLKSSAIAAESGDSIYKAESKGFTNPWHDSPIANCIFPTTTTTTITISDPSNPQKPPDDPTPCVATFVLGADNPNLENLRYFRDSRLAQSAVGRRIIQIYYNNADSINAALQHSSALRSVTRSVLEVIAPIVGRKEE